MTFNIVLIFCAISLLSLFPFERVKNMRKIENILFILTSVFLIFFAAFRDPSSDRDYEAYFDWFKYENEHVEFTYHYLSSFVNNYLNHNFLPLLFFYAAVSIGIKFFCIKLYSKYLFSSVVAYIGYLYCLQDLTQIRAGMATAFIFLSFKYVYERKFVPFLVCYLLAVSFHYSSFFAIFFYFINPRKIKPVYLIFSIIASYVVIIFLKNPIAIISDYLPVFIKKKTEAYEYEMGSKLNIFNAWQLLRCVVAVILMIFAKKINAKNQYFILFIKLYTIAICSFIILSVNPVFASRISDLMFISDLIVFTGFIYLVKNEFLGRLVCVILSALFLYLNLSYIGIFYN